jgi:hypothetical protein
MLTEIRFKYIIPTILKYLPKEEKIKWSRKFMEREIYSEIIIKKIKDYRQFEKWCKIFKPNSIEKVIISFHDTDIYTPCVIDYMPSCVKTVIIEEIQRSCYGNEHIMLSDTVETLILKNTQSYIFTLPLKLKNLILDSEFKGIVSFFHLFHKDMNKYDNNNLETVVLKGYFNSNEPLIITHMPENIKNLVIYSSFNAEFNDWPIHIEHLELLL